MGAPSGSIYHRFRSRDELLGRLWLTKAQSFQNRWSQALENPDARLAGLEAALALPRAVRDDLEGARIMLLHRREDFLERGWPAEMQREAQRLGQQVQDVLAMTTRRLFGRNTASARQVTTFAGHRPTSAFLI
jgi:AcrR family transcriptional regulator